MQLIIYLFIYLSTQSWHINAFLPPCREFKSHVAVDIRVFPFATIHEQPFPLSACYRRRTLRTREKARYLLVPGTCTHDVGRTWRDICAYIPDIVVPADVAAILVTGCISRGLSKTWEGGISTWGVWQPCDMWLPRCIALFIIDVLSRDAFQCQALQQQRSKR
jgi:hypothetical protein